METRTNSITPPDSILLGSSVRGEGSASGKHPINKGRFYTRARVSSRGRRSEWARVYMRERERGVLRVKDTRVRDESRAAGGKEAERRMKQDGG